MNIPLSWYASENLISRDGFSRPVPRQPAHSILRLNLVLTHGIPPDFCAASIYCFKPPYAIGSVPSLSSHEFAHRWHSLSRVRWHRAGKPQGSSKRMLSWQVTMDHAHCHFTVPLPSRKLALVAAGVKGTLACTPWLVLVFCSHGSDRAVNLNRVATSCTSSVYPTKFQIPFFLYFPKFP